MGIAHLGGWVWQGDNACPDGLGHFFVHVQMGSFLFALGGGGGEVQKLCGQCPFERTTFQKGASLNAFDHFATFCLETFGESGLETCCNKDSNDLFDQLFLLL